MSRPSLLLLSHTVPYPPDGGPWIRTYNLLRVLAEHFSVHMLCFERAVAPGDGFVYEESASIAALREICPVEVFPIPQRHGRARFVADHLRSVATGRVYTEYMHASAGFRARLRDLLAERTFDLVHVDSLDLSAYLPLLQHLRVACTHHNVESQLFRRRARAETSPVVRRYAALQARLMEATERRWCPRVALNVVVSREDEAELRRIAPRARCTVVPNGVDPDTFSPGTERPGAGLVFVGGTHWFPNRDALDHFCADILPRLRQTRPEMPVTWIGATTEADRRHYREHGITLTGYVDDIRPYVQAAECFIAPLRVGGGSRLKILDAWAMGKAVVSTSVGCEGLEAVDDQNLLVADGGDAFADAIERVLGSPALRARLGEAARATTCRHYTWDVIGGGLVNAYAAVLERTGGAVRR